MSTVSYVRRDPDTRLAFRLYMRSRRKRLKSKNLCVNAASHGKRVKGGRCAMCWERKTGNPVEPPSL